MVGRSQADELATNHVEEVPLVTSIGWTLAAAAEARGWTVHWYDAKKVCDAAGKAVRIEDFDAYFLRLRRSMGPPWGKDHKIAMAAAIVAVSAR